jgi:hypothetical protein
MCNKQHNDIFGHGYHQIERLPADLTEQAIACLQRQHRAVFSPETVVHSDPLGFGYSTGE